MKPYIIFFVLMLSLSALAQAPQGLNYQATVRNSSGDLVSNSTVGFKFTLVQGSASGSTVYSETHTSVPTDDLGHVNLTVGAGAAELGNYTQIDWSLGNYFLSIELDNGKGYVTMGTTQLLSVPYALYAETSGSATTSSGLDEVLSQNNSANTQQIKDLADPTENQDATSKVYVDTNIDALEQQNSDMSALIAEMQASISNLETEVAALVNTGIYTPTLQSGTGTFKETKYMKIGNTYFVFGNFSGTELSESTNSVVIDIPTSFIFSNATEVSGAVSAVMGFGESVGGFVEAIPGTNHVRLHGAGAHMSAFDSSGSFIFSFKENSGGTSYTPTVANGQMTVAQTNYEVTGTRVLVNGNFSNGDFDGSGITVDISVPTSTVFSNSTDVSGVVTGIGFGESVNGYIEAVPGTSNVRIAAAGGHGMAYGTKGSYTFTYETNAGALTYTPTLISGSGTFDSVNYFKYGTMVVVSGKFSNLSSNSVISIPISNYFSDDVEVSGIISAKDFESFGGYIESVSSSESVKFILKGAHKQTTAQDGSFFYVYKL